MTSWGLKLSKNSTFQDREAVFPCPLRALKIILVMTKFTEIHVEERSVVSILKTNFAHLNHALAATFVCCFPPRSCAWPLAADHNKPAHRAGNQHYKTLNGLGNSPVVDCSPGPTRRIRRKNIPKRGTSATSYHVIAFGRKTWQKPFQM